MWQWFLQGLCVLVLGLIGQHVQAKSLKTIYEKIRNESEYARFNDLVWSNWGAKLILHYEPLTLFVPQNKALDQYEGDTDSDLAFYHMSFEVKTLKLLKTTNMLLSAKLNYPPLWITKVNDDIYVNNAKILQDKSNYVSRSFSGNTGQQQVLHVIDGVLDPMIKSPKFSPNAYDYLISPHNWYIGTSKTITKYHQRVQDNRLLEVFKKIQPHTFFIPIDSGIDPQKYKMIDRKVVLRHVVPNHVLFTRPSEKNVVTLSDDDDSSYTLSFERSNDILFVKYTSKDNFEESSSEIIVPDIPVKNGVVHLISQPLGNFHKSLKPFPYLPIIEKISRDPEIDTFYKLGSTTKFNDIFKRDVNFTYFVPKDSAWGKISNLGLEPVDSPNDILAKHLVISEIPYSMQQLVSMTRVNNYTDVELHSEAGPLRMSVFQEEGEYFIKWKRKYIRVLRPDYECTNGIIHILNGPFIDFRRKQFKNDYSKSLDSRDSLVGYWNILKGIVL